MTNWDRSCESALATCMRVLADDDVWMHARQQPGSHLVMRIPAGSSAAKEDIQYAANLSVFFSKARGSGKWDVTMCSGKDVTKPKGAKPGQVCSHEPAKNGQVPK